MLQRLTAGLVLLLALTFASSGFAQDVKKDVKKETKPAVAPDTKKDAKPAAAPAVKKDVKKDAKKSTKPPTFKYVACSQPGCGFWAKSHSRKELQSIIKRHSKRHHKVDLTDKQVKDMVKMEGAK